MTDRSRGRKTRGRVNDDDDDNATANHSLEIISSFSSPITIRNYTHEETRWSGDNDSLCMIPYFHFHFYLFKK